MYEKRGFFGGKRKNHEKKIDFLLGE